MKTYLVIVEIQDGENEYEPKYLISAKTFEKAWNKAEKTVKTWGDRWDTREYSVNGLSEIPKEDVKTLEKYFECFV